VREARGGITWQADVLEGRADGRPPLVLLHGPAFDRSMWQPALAELCVADPGRQALALDLPGHGGSPPPRRHDIDGVLAAVHEAVRWTRLDAPVVVGHAMAAVIATVYAARYPARGVVNVNQWLRAEPPAAPGTWVADEIRGGGFSADRRLPGDSWQLPGRPDGPGWPPDALAADVDIQAVLAKIGAAETDYLFIAGHEVEPQYRRWLRQLVPRASIEVFPGSGHLPQLDRPERFAACLATMGRWPVA
jgi:pimeloyl-ACP methyl ester carboxylesterase